MSIAAAFCFAGMAYCVRQTAGSLTPGVAVFYRSLVGALFLLPFVLKGLPSILKSRAKPLWLRGVAGCLASYLYFWNVQESSVGDAGMLLNLSPVFAAGLAWVALKEKLSSVQLTGIFVSLAGLSAVGFDRHSTLTPFVIASGGFGALLSAVAFTALRKAASEFSALLVVETYMISGLVLSFLFESRSLLHSFSELQLGLGTENQMVYWAMLGGVLGLLGQVLFTLAFISLEAAVATTLSLTSVIWGTILEMQLDGRQVGVSMWIAYGVVLIGAAILQLSALGSRSPKTGVEGVVSGEVLT